MAKYEYKGRSKVISRVPQRKTSNSKHIIDTCNFIIFSSYPVSGVKKLGSPLVNEHYGEEVLNLHLDLIQSVCESPNILVVSGFESKKILKSSRRNEFQVIENLIFEFTNSSEDLRISLNAAPRNASVVIDGAFLPSKETYELLLQDQLHSKTCYSTRKSDCIGIHTDDDKVINYYGYRCEKKTKGAYYISLLDFDRLRKKMLGSSFNKNQFDYEVLSELKMLGVEDLSKSLRLDENYDVKD